MEFELYRAGRRFYSRLTDARKWGKLIGVPVYKWLPMQERKGGPAWVQITDKKGGNIEK